MQARVVQHLDETVWREFVAGTPAGNIFHTPEMFQVFARAKRHRPCLWAALDGDQRPLALLLPVHVSVVDGLLRRFTTRAIAYGSVLCAPSSEAKEALAALLHTYKLEVGGDAVFTELRNLSDIDDLQPVLNDSGFTHADHLNYLVNLDCSPEAVLQNIGQRTRKKIRHALRQGKVTVEECSRPEQAAICYRLLQKTYAAAQVPLADWSLFEATFDILYPQGMVKFLLARIGDDYAAGSIELIYKDRIYGWYGGLDRAYSDYIPNELLLWYIFQWGAENGYKVYDFGGAGKPDEEYGVRDFKAKFGGQLVCYGRNTCAHMPRLSRLSQSAYAVYRKFL